MVIFFPESFWFYIESLKTNYTTPKINTRRLHHPRLIFTNILYKSRNFLTKKIIPILNKCETTLTTQPSGIDLLVFYNNGSQWYPNQLKHLGAAQTTNVLITSRFTDPQFYGVLEEKTILKLCRNINFVNIQLLDLS